MQYILTEQEYNKLKEKEEMLNEVQKYIFDSMEYKPKYEYAYGKHGEKLTRYLISCDTQFNNLNFAKLFELLGIKFEGNVSMTFSELR